MSTRRKFIKSGALAATFLPVAGGVGWNLKVRPAEKLNINVFSKHLQFLDYQDMAKMAAQIGFDGVDLTVRPKGHVEPENVKTDLPKAIDAIGNAGFKPLMMTTAVDDANDPVDKTLLETAAQFGIKYYRMNWLRYPENMTVPQAITQFQNTIKGLAELNGSLGLVGCYQNHSGTMAGASIHELYYMVEPSDPQAMGVQYDIRHAVVEGGMSWETGLRLIAPRIRTLCLKDFRWEKIDGEWKVLNTPLGEGMVDFKRYFALLKKYRVQVPVSLHYEYDLGGANRGAREISIKPDKVYEAMHKDLAYARKAWDEA